MVAVDIEEEDDDDEEANSDSCCDALAWEENQNMILLQGVYDNQYRYVYRTQ